MLEKPTGDWFGHASVRDDVFEQFTAGEFKDDDDVGGGGDDLVSGYEIGGSERGGMRRESEWDVQLDDVGMSEHAHVFHLSLDSSFGFCSVDDLLGDVFHGDFMTGDGVNGL